MVIAGGGCSRRGSGVGDLEKERGRERQAGRDTYASPMPEQSQSGDFSPVVFAVVALLLLLLLL